MLKRLAVLFKGLGGFKGLLTLVAFVAHCRVLLLCRFGGLLLQRLSMSTAFHVCYEGVNIFEEDVTIATLEFGSMCFGLAMSRV